jgi:hypothetical protein
MSSLSLSLSTKKIKNIRHFYSALSLSLSHVDDEISGYSENPFFS